MLKANMKYDVVVIGAGPVGIYFSTRLARSGFSVLVIEEDSEIGRPRFCTGLISKEAFERFDLPRQAIEREFSSARLFSPLGSELRVGEKNFQVYAVDRALFDKTLYHKARREGVEFLLNCRCLELRVCDSYVEERLSLEGGIKAIKSSVVILTTGIKYNLHSDVGLTRPKDFLDCSQVQLSGEGNGEVEIFVGNKIAPRSFAWIVPLRQKQLRVGISTHKDSLFFLKAFLKTLELKGRIQKKNVDIIRRPIPLGALNRTYAHRALAIGDAAGQVKPTTGGGVYFGILCAEVAAEAITEAFKKGDFSSKFLRRYEIGWRKKIEFDLTMGLYIRKLLADCGDTQIEQLFQFCSQDSIQRLIEKYADFNHHGRFIKELVKLPIFWKNLYKLLIARSKG